MECRGGYRNNAAAEAAGDAAEEVVGPVAREAVAEELKTSRPEKVGITAAKAVLKCIFGGEEVVRSAVSTRIQSITMQRKVDKIATILKLLTLKWINFSENGLGRSMLVLGSCVSANCRQSKLCRGAIDMPVKTVGRSEKLCTDRSAVYRGGDRLRLFLFRDDGCHRQDRRDKSTTFASAMENRV